MGLRESRRLAELFDRQGRSSLSEPEAAELKSLVDLYGRLLHERQMWELAENRGVPIKQAHREVDAVLDAAQACKSNTGCPLSSGRLPTRERRERSPSPRRLPARSNSTRNSRALGRSPPAAAPARYRPPTRQPATDPGHCARVGVARGGLANGGASCGPPRRSARQARPAPRPIAPPLCRAPSGREAVR